MKKLLIAPILIFLSMACTSQPDYSKLLVQADSLMSSRPDSALHILQDITLQQFATQADKAYYALLLTQARDKNYIQQTDDSLIQRAVQYYDSTNDRKMQAQAYYYWGSVYRDKNEQAIATEKKEIATLQNEIIRQHISEEHKQTLEAELTNLNEQHTALVKKIRQYSDVIQKIDNILSIYKEKKIPKEFLDENDWARLLAETDKKGVINRINEMYRLSEIEFHLCSLLLLDYSVADMGRIIQRERASVYRIEGSILKKMGRKYQAGELQKLLKSMISDSSDK